MRGRVGEFGKIVRVCFVCYRAQERTIRSTLHDGHVYALTVSFDIIDMLFSIDFSDCCLQRYLLPFSVRSPLSAEGYDVE